MVVEFEVWVLEWKSMVASVDAKKNVNRSIPNYFKTYYLNSDFFANLKGDKCKT